MNQYIKKLLYAAIFSSSILAIDDARKIELANIKLKRKKSIEEKFGKGIFSNNTPRTLEEFRQQIAQKKLNKAENNKP